MAAATGPITITDKQGAQVPMQYLTVPVKASTTIYAGTLVVADAGYAAPGRTATGLVALGRAAETVVNSGSNGAKSIRVDRGAFIFNNATSTDAVTQASLGASVYVLDDNTVTITATGRSVAGKFIGFEGGRPVVEIY